MVGWGKRHPLETQGDPLDDPTSIESVNARHTTAVEHQDAYMLAHGHGEAHAVYEIGYKLTGSGLWEWWVTQRHGWVVDGKIVTRRTLYAAERHVVDKGFAPTRDEAIECGRNVIRGTTSAYSGTVTVDPTEEET